MDPSDLYIKLAKFHIIFYYSLVFRLVYVSSLLSMSSKTSWLLDIKLKDASRIYCSNHPKNKLLNGSCSKCSINGS